MHLSNVILSAVIWVFGGHHSQPCRVPSELAGRYVDTILAGVGIGIARPEAPWVLLRETNPLHPHPAGEVLSTDVPEYWTVVPYATLSVTVSLLADAAVPRVEHVLLLLDGVPIENNRNPAGPLDPPELLADGRLRLTYIYNLPCPELGRHLIQARYKIDGMWSELSAPLRYEVRLPPPPRIIAISDAEHHPMPLAATGQISIRSANLKFRLANVNNGDTVVTYLNGKVIDTGQVDANCCRLVRIQGHVAPGMHQLSVRRVYGADACSITTEASNEIVLHYHDKDVYLLRPGRGCENANFCRPWPSRPAGATLPPPSPSPTPAADEHLRHAELARNNAAHQNQLAQAAARTAAAARAEANAAAAAAERATALTRPITAPRSVDERIKYAKSLAQEAGLHATVAEDHTRSASKKIGLTSAALVDARLWAQRARRAAADAEIKLTTSRPWGDATFSQAATRLIERMSTTDLEATNAITTAATLLENAESAAAEAKMQAGKARRHADRATTHSLAVQQSTDDAAQPSRDIYRVVIAAEQNTESAMAAQKRAANAWARAEIALSQSQQFVATAKEHAETILEIVEKAKDVLQSKADITAAWDNADFRDLKREAAFELDAAQPTASAEDSAPQDVLRAQADRNAAQRSANAEEAKADSRIAAFEANQRTLRATATHAPPSPFYFASAAYFPIRNFGLRGEVIDSERAVIYEDMRFSFDREGNYALEFALSTPAVPATIRMQLLVQPSTGAPWYTITLPPMRFKPELGERSAGCSQSTDPKQCEVLYNHKCSGRSEILRRCYPQMAGDATIRREATARFGYGFEATRQAAAF